VYNLDTQVLTSRSKANAPARAFHVGTMYYAGRAMTSEARRWVGLARLGSLLNFKGPSEIPIEL
jgi:hypothetical protein